MSAPLHLRRTFLLLGGAMLVVFAVLVAGLTLNLRQRLRRDIELRHAAAIYAVAVMEIDAGQARAAELRLPFETPDVFTAVLGSSRLGGVLAVQLFDHSGSLLQALPAIADTFTAVVPWWNTPLRSPDARFHAHGTLEQVFGLPAQAGDEVTPTPLLEVVAPLGRRAQDGSLGVARYWIDGTPLVAEFARLDRSLAAQSGAAFAGAALLLVLLLAWAYRQLARAHHRVLEQTAELARANEELDFAAKTGALGAISAHLIHGLKNPLAGLEGYVLESAQTESLDETARRSAMDTARRLRNLVNEVVAVLRDERSTADTHDIPVEELTESVHARELPLATDAGVTLTMRCRATGAIGSRTANLAGLVLANLISNAIEASPRGADVALEAADASEGGLEFTVADRGAGLPEAIRASLFRPVRSTKAGGGGMGLAISSRLARHAGGELVLVRSDASGTVFKLTVPRR